MDPKYKEEQEESKSILSDTSTPTTSEAPIVDQSQEGLDQKAWKEQVNNSPELVENEAWKNKIIDFEEEGQPLTKEERKYGLVNTTTDKIIDAQCALFNKEIKKANSKEEISAIINTHGLRIWNHATTKVKDSKTTEQDSENWNDQAIYKARLKMRISLKKSSNPLLKKMKKKELDLYIETLEKVSRGMTTVEFSKESEKKILLTGFDPYQGAETNPSGIVALNFDNKKVGNAEIQTAVFPVRYEDFDNGLVEKFFGTKIDDIDAIITVSQTGVSQNIDVDRFSANVRGGGLDNNEESETGKILDDGANFYESSLPYEEILKGEPTREDQRYFYNQTWATDENDSNEDNFPGYATNKGTPWNSDKQINDLETLNKSGTPTQGSGGDYLSNEIHYRVSKIRTASKATKDMPQGHLHIKDVSNKKVFMNDMEKLIARIVSTLNKK